MLFGEEPAGCVPGTSRVVRNGSTIDVHLQIAGSVCLSVPTSWQFSAPLGVLDAGVYDVAASVDGARTLRIVHSTLIVRGSEFRVVPAAIPTSGGAVTLEGIDRFSISAIKFSDRFGDIFGGIKAPPHELARRT